MDAVVCEAVCLLNRSELERAFVNAFYADKARLVSAI